MLAATNTSHPVSAPSSTPTPAPVSHLPPLPPSVPQLPPPAVHPPYHGAPPPQQMPQSFYPPQVSMHSSPAAPPPQQQQQPLAYYGVPQLPPQQQPPVAPAGAIDGIDPSQKVRFPFNMCRRHISLTGNVEGNATPSPSFDTRSNQSAPTFREGCHSCSCEFISPKIFNATVLMSLYSDPNLVILHD